MIYTVTFNPSLDYIVSVDDFQTRTYKPYKLRTHASGWKMGIQCFYRA